jgi:hypothetical protein
MPYQSVIRSRLASATRSYVTLFEEIQGGMMEATRRYGDGEIGILRFALSFYSRWFTIFAVASFGSLLVILGLLKPDIIDVSSGNEPAVHEEEETKGRE